MKWIPINSMYDLPKEDKEYLFDGDEGEPPIWAKVIRNEVFAGLVVYSRLEEDWEYVDWKLYKCYLDDSTSPVEEKIGELFLSLYEADGEFAAGGDTVRLIQELHELIKP